MSASNRSLARLPLCIFSNLQQKNDTIELAQGGRVHEQDQNLVEEEKSPQHQDVHVSSPTLSPTQLRAEICSKLKQNSIIIGEVNSHLNQIKHEITTVGQVLKLTPLVLLRTLDPLLTYSESLYNVQGKKNIVCIRRSQSLIYA